MIGKKICFKCQQSLTLDNFYRHPQMGDGHLNKCKECTKKDVGENRAAKWDYYNEYDKWRYRNIEGRRERYYAFSKRHAAEKKKANSALANAVRDGRVVKPEGCWNCGSTRNVEGHHVHYELLPIDVVWLCRSCHIKAHKQQYDYERQANGSSEANRRETGTEAQRAREETPRNHASCALD